jgi:hypothetical protein
MIFGSSSGAAKAVFGAAENGSAAMASAKGLLFDLR